VLEVEGKPSTVTHYVQWNLAEIEVDLRARTVVAKEYMSLQEGSAMRLLG
jgi:hypothetical protein